MTIPYPLGLCVPGRVADIGRLSTGEWTMEPKLDGFRIQAVTSPAGVQLFTRTGRIATGKMPLVEPRLAAFGAAGLTVLDGEAVVFVEGKPDFNATASTMGSATDKCRARQAVTGHHVRYCLFDVLILAGTDLRTQPFSARHEYVTALSKLAGDDAIRVVPQADVCVTNHDRFVADYGEGSVLKELDAPYPGRRSPTWVKIKKSAQADVVLTGARPGNGKFYGQIGAVTFGQYRNGALTHRGTCSGMDDRTRAFITANLPSLIGRVFTITYNGDCGGDGFRHPQFHRWRNPNDKGPEQCTWDTVA